MAPLWEKLPCWYKSKRRPNERGIMIHGRRDIAAGSLFSLRTDDTAKSKTRLPYIWMNLYARTPSYYIRWCFRSHGFSLIILWYTHLVLIAEFLQELTRSAFSWFSLFPFTHSAFRTRSSSFSETQNITHFFLLTHSGFWTYLRRLAFVVLVSLAYGLFIVWDMGTRSIICVHKPSSRPTRLASCPSKSIWAL